MNSNFLEKLDQEKTERIIGDNDNLVQIKNEEAKRAEAVAELAVKTFQQKCIYVLFCLLTIIFHMACGKNVLKINLEISSCFPTSVSDDGKCFHSKYICIH